MKLSDYVVDFLEKQGVNDVFLLAGGGIMHLLNSLAKNEHIHKYYTLHEQGAGFAADGYAQCSNKLGVVFVTTGPGATNAITALGSAYIDSTPMLVISGQVKTADITKIQGVRQTGAQEISIVPIVEPITKYAVTVTDSSKIRYEMEKAIFLAKHGRPGPVWIDLPLDIQAEEIEPERLDSFEIKKLPNERLTAPNKVEIRKIYNMLKQAKRPCILAGSGIFMANGVKEFLDLVNDLKVPVLTSQRVKRIFHRENGRYYYGNIGRIGPRYGNYTLQNSDFMLSIGSGLRYYLTVFDESYFAPKAQKVVVNICKAEIDKLRMPLAASLVCDAKIFIQELRKCYLEDNDRLQVSAEWLDYCDTMRDKYPIEKDVLLHDDGLSDGYMTAWAIQRYAKEDDLFLASPSAFCYTYNSQLRGQQDYVCPMGLGSMGTALPAAIGACIAAKGRRIIVGEGDGSLQHNIQELALLHKYQLPMKLFIDTNHGYRQIYTMQNTHFAGRLAGCTESSGIEFPNLEKIAEAYGLEYLCIDKAENTDKIVKQALADDKPMIIEVMSSMQTEFVPIIKSRMGKNGKMSSSKLEDMYPYLPEEEQAANMKISEG